MAKDRILIADDEADIALILKLQLEDAGYGTVRVKDGVEALDALAKERFELILLDINLPDIDGYEVARRLRKSSKTALAYVPIIAITANALKGDAEKALAAGCDVYMSKPINLRELWARVEGFVPSPNS